MSTAVLGSSLQDKEEGEKEEEKKFRGFLVEMFNVLVARGDFSSPSCI